ncbi:MAG: 2-C-methyl-D-erythritol 4-phosphate cytidylyltransferase [Desulfobacterales bacterium]|nr:2-C-methyl-D-erythritol 4-phosphate cytidylyltransferase [Desulfobacterales bacterium]
MNIALIVAGGSGRRMQSDRPKQYLDLGGTPILCRTLAVFADTDMIDRIVLVAPEGDTAYCQDDLVPRAGLGGSVDIVPGGPTRQASVFNGLEAIDAADGDLVVIHDAVRPFLQAAELEACIWTADETGACILALRAFDTVKEAGPDGRIAATVDRESLWLAQTPQVFRYGLIRKAHTLARQKGVLGTDDAALLEMAGQPVSIVPGSRLNIKITAPGDLALARAILSFL